MAEQPQRVVHPGGPQVGVVRRLKLWQVAVDLDEARGGHGNIPRTGTGQWSGQERLSVANRPRQTQHDPARFFREQK